MRTKKPLKEAVFQVKFIKNKLSELKELLQDSKTAVAKMKKIKGLLK